MTFTRYTPGPSVSVGVHVKTPAAVIDASGGKVTDAHLRWVIYIPYATPESTGLSTKASDSAPWLMYPGKAGAHVMINPPRPPKP